MLSRVVALAGLVGASLAVTCGDHQGVCNALYTLRPHFSNINCGATCSNGECCLPTCATLSLSHCRTNKGDTYNLKSHPDTHRCAGNTCTADECCDNAESATTDAVGARGLLPHTMVYCTQDSHCRVYGDAVATCGAGGQCVCSHKYELDAGHKCRLRIETRNIAVTFTGLTECRLGEVAQGVQDSLYSLVESLIDGVRVVGRNTHCVKEAGKLTYRGWAVIVAEVPLPSGQLSTAADALGALNFIKRTLPNVDKLAVDAQGCTYAPNVAGLQQNALGVLCLATRCTQSNQVFRRASYPKRTVCFASAGKPADCRVDLDCPRTGAADTLHRCVSGICQDVKTLQYKAVQPRPVKKDWCTEDSHCRVYGDSGATCNKDSGLGNWCKCRHGYAYPVEAKFVGQCRLRGQAPLETIPLSTTVSYGHFLACPVSSDLTKEVESLVRNVLKSVTSIQAFCTPAKGVSFVALSDVPTQLAQELTEATGSDYLRSKFVVEKERGNRRNIAPAAPAAPSRAAAALAIDRVAGADATLYPLLTFVDPQTVFIGAIFDCTSKGATTTVLDANSKCQAYSCMNGYNLVDVAGVKTCLLPQTTQPPVVVDTDDELTTGQKAAIAMGIVSFVGVCIAVLVGMSVCGGSSAAQHEELDEKELEVVEDV